MSSISYTAKIKSQQLDDFFEDEKKEE